MTNTQNIDSGNNNPGSNININSSGDISNSDSRRKKYPWTARRVMALVGIILLLAMYGMTMVFALIGSPASKGLLMASIFCTIAVPILLYAMQMVARNLRGKGRNGEDSDSSDDRT